MAEEWRIGGMESRKSQKFRKRDFDKKTVKTILTQDNEQSVWLRS